MTELGTLLQRTHDALRALESQCVACGTCSSRCDVLEPQSWNIRSLCEASHEALDNAHDLESVRQGIDGQPELYHMLRSCEACNRCTVHCPQQLNMSDLWRPWRALIRGAGYIDDGEVGLIKVDCTWNTFSVYRRLYGIDYSDLPLLEVPPAYPAQANDSEASEAPQERAHAETMFFPGCTLCSYAPELTRTALAWLNEHVGPTLLATQCCAWPLECAGEIDRARIWRERVVKAAYEQGVRRIVGVCPGCDRQLEEATRSLGLDIEFVPYARLLVDAGIRITPEAASAYPLPCTVVDSCNDRAGIHGPEVRRLFERVESSPFPCTGEDAWCCGAGGNVSSYDELLSRKRTCRSFRLCEQAGARTLVTACPTCAYTYAFERWMESREGNARWSELESTNYLEVVFGQRIDWPAAFNNLMSMWQGENAPWVAAQLARSIDGRQ